MKRKFNPIPKNLRDKKRYVLIDNDSTNVRDLISQELSNLYGLVGLSDMNIKFEKNNLIRVNLDGLGKLIFTINYINMKNLDYKINVVKISGTLQGLDLDGK